MLVVVAGIVWLPLLYGVNFFYESLWRAFHGFRWKFLEYFSAYSSPWRLKLASITQCCLLYLQNNFWLITVIFMTVLFSEMLPKVFHFQMDVPFCITWVKIPRQKCQTVDSLPVGELCFCVINILTSFCCLVFPVCHIRVKQLQYRLKVMSHSLAFLLRVTGYTRSRKESTIHSNSTRHSRIFKSQLSCKVLLYTILEVYR